MHTGGISPVFSYLDPLLDVGVQPTVGASNRIIVKNGQFFPLVDQGNDGLKSFYNNVPVYHSLLPQDVYLQYYFFTIHTSSCGMYVDLYY